MMIVGVGVRLGFIIDMGWEEIVVISVYEYREVKSMCSVCGGWRLLD